MAKHSSRCILKSIQEITKNTVKNDYARMKGYSVMHFKGKNKKKDSFIRFGIMRKNNYKQNDYFVLLLL